MVSYETVCAIATAQGSGAISVIRITGKSAIPIVSKVFRSRNQLEEKPGFSLSFGEIIADGELVDEVLVSLFRAPKSYTGEDMIEISCHASPYIQQKIIEILLNEGASLANPGEFTQRAYLNGKLDLSQAEAVADIINSQSEAMHRVAIQQMRGGYSERIKELRKKLLHFVSLIELELDFSEEDVEFADRSQLVSLAEELYGEITKLSDSFRLGNALKKGIPIAIVGRPNVGKSTLLNSLLGEERAIVSDIPGTTRDIIEDTMVIKGVTYRFIDTAGMRKTADVIEKMGIERTWEKIDAAEVVLLIIDTTDKEEENVKVIKELQNHLNNTDKMLLLVVNKIDKQPNVNRKYESVFPAEYILPISAKNKENVGELSNKLHQHYQSLQRECSDMIVSNMRHFELLKKAQKATERIKDGLQCGIPTDFISQDIREVLHHLGSITGEISTDDILGSIFQNFCIGK